ncbi:MAG: class I SAM-dependent methyltransferase [Patescibacteria group bacterium]|nr:class I SAM-dependent methyltransferase [Patescibacteria group bacterium]
MGINTVSIDTFLSHGDLPKAHLITLWHSLEHLPKPELYLRRIHKLLTDDGLVAIAVPNLQARGVGRVGLHWVWIQQPFVHIWHWTPKSLAQLLHQNNFTIVKIFTRDTWDANYIFDALVGRYFHRGFNLVERIFRKTFLASAMKNLRIYSEQIVRVMCYIAYLTCKMFRKNDSDMHGSELIIIAQKKLQKTDARF